MGGLSGPAVFPVAVRMVWQVASAVSVPVLGMGGVSSGDNAVELMLAGADLVGVGTVCFDDPYAPVKIIKEINEYMKNNSIQKVNELKGKVVLH
jgi:dihydroorotate dehydrogenase (NAD+) catalytic subunit